jgi:uncharacterized protein
MMKSSKTLTWIAIALVVIGGLNWLLVGAFEFDLVAALFGEMSGVSRAVYVLVGLAAIYTIFAAPRLIRHDPPPMQALTH